MLLPDQTLCFQNKTAIEGVICDVFFLLGQSIPSYHIPSHPIPSHHITRPFHPYVCKVGPAGQAFMWISASSSALCNSSPTTIMNNYKQLPLQRANMGRLQKTNEISWNVVQIMLMFAGCNPKCRKCPFVTMVFPRGPLLMRDLSPAQNSAKNVQVV